VALLGRIGSGKSTLLKLCAGLLAPTGGWIRFRGEQLTRPRLFRLASRGLFYLGEETNLVPTLTLAEHVALIRQRYEGIEQDVATETLQVTSLLQSPTGSYSPGERRRAEIALALVRNPACLIVDEAFRGIDPMAVEVISGALRTLAQSGCAIVVSGHEMRAILPIADTVTWVTAGTTYEFETVEKALQNERFQREYLGDAGSLKPG
jgi:ABC-type multidrug transport system ATPase subunit